MERNVREQKKSTRKIFGMQNFSPFWKAFSENRPFLQICFHILFSDFIAPGFLTRPLAGHLAAFEQMQRRGLADVAYSEELLLVHHLENAVPVDGKYIHL